MSVDTERCDFCEERMWGTRIRCVPILDEGGVVQLERWCFRCAMLDDTQDARHARLLKGHG